MQLPGLHATAGHNIGSPMFNVRQSIGWFDFTNFISFVLFFFFRKNFTISQANSIYLRLRPLKFKASYFIQNPFAIACRWCAFGLFLPHFKSYFRSCYKCVMCFRSAVKIPGTPASSPKTTAPLYGCDRRKQILFELHSPRHTRQMNWKWICWEWFERKRSRDLPK